MRLPRTVPRAAIPPSSPIKIRHLLPWTARPDAQRVGAALHVKVVAVRHDVVAPGAQIQHSPRGANAPVAEAQVGDAANFKRRLCRLPFGDDPDRVSGG